MIEWFKDLWQGIRIVGLFLMFFWFIGFLARLAWGIIMVGWSMV